MDNAILEDRLSNFDPKLRREALDELAHLAKTGAICLPDAKSEVNLHFHTFFSFNANGWSPTRIAWESRKYGLEIAGIVDFDVLDGINEFLSAGAALGQRAVAGLESRVFISELADKVINSPNEPGIAYFMACGCYKLPQPGSKAAAILSRMRGIARQRGEEIARRVNDYLGTVRLDYDRDVIPLTPSGNATERHLLMAYDLKAREIAGDDLAGFWAGKLGVDKTEMEALIPQTAKFHELLRAKLMKFGSVGYVAPDKDSFPSIEDVVEMIHGIDAVPTCAWLDGTNPGEQDAMALMTLMQTKGVEVLNIIPDRNWNINNAEEKALKLDKLKQVVDACHRLGLPIIVGTEMNKAGLPFVDDFSAPELAPYVNDFLSGARWVAERTGARWEGA